ncbi:hypothetical protein [Pseudomonas nitroreducens]|uniref:Uncharacterized protein n=1 Tax=Pseudomonas nitroreducens TaxID=46680 RepID=A0A6G6J651_PSENT|nr:hypothetical protein [Pseudomonas nitroreducens]MBG6289422.1 hypothetical protein [Pseudomonas nitroreducens]MDG9855387.1 hypothetical protein [Pseudomonas nitroreducens]NMZ60339.1 hypothetical protein [Pseudomonas nitroreducens]QIE89951.1 hypothetical protein G5B91_28370 [Pseudomonas nitroreducens]SNT31124.1 hypothetical protein SAMN05216209_4287 [Pseudomonas nitroreducens]
MKTIQLQHDARLGYLAPKQLRHIPAELALTENCQWLFSFRQFKGKKPDVSVRKLHAAKRPLDIYGAGSYCFYGVQSDSPLSPLLLWDAAHFLAVGQSLTLIEDAPTDSFLDRDYFRDALVCTERSASRVTYQKKATLPAQSDDDLDSWTFGLPVGPEDATVLNAVVQRILELDIPNKEILLCGVPGKNFRYFDQVRIVGEDITAPPVQICKKKNRLAQEARYSNLVILHDRVFLPSHFGEMVRRFGPRYPLMTLQSLFFDNVRNFGPRRYSDYGMAMGSIGQGMKGLHRTADAAVSIAPALFAEIERTGFCFASPMRYSKDLSYPTGSLYICRKEVWNAFPLDESLLWAEFEDIEHGIRASHGGVPTRVNPYGITQSITSRALLGVESPVESINGRYVATGPSLLSALRKKPLLRFSADEALIRLQRFAQKYVAADAALHIPTGMKTISSRAWLKLVDRVVQNCSFGNDLDSVLAFIKDYEKWVLLDQLPNTMVEAIAFSFQDDPRAAKRNLVYGSSEFRNMLRQRPLQSWFFQSLGDYFHPRALALPGTLMSAISLYRRNGGVFYFPGFTDCVRAIHNSTPFRSYVERIG